MILGYECKHCGGTIRVDTEKPSNFCRFCGNPITVDQDALVALTTEAEKTNRVKMALEAKERMYNKQWAKDMLDRVKEFWKLWLLILVPVVILVVCLCVLSSKEYKKLPFGPKDTKSMNYLDVQRQFEAAGFGQIQFVIRSDDELGQTYKEGQVVEVKVNGTTKYKKGQRWRNTTTFITVSFYSPDGCVSLPISYDQTTSVDYHSVETALRERGFSNIIMTVRKRSAIDIFHKNDEVKTVTVDGKENFTSGDRVALDVPIVIEYYSSNWNDGWIE